jgi:hypothetical protein
MSCSGCRHGYNDRPIKAAYPCECCRRNPAVEIGDYFQTMTGRDAKPCVCGHFPEQHTNGICCAQLEIDGHKVRCGCDGYRTTND